MIVGLLAALVLVQAEAAPPEPATVPEPERPVTEQPTPVEPVEPPPPTSPPEAATPAPPPGAEPVGPPPYFIGVGFGGARRLDPAASDVPPTYGLQFASLLGRRYLLVGDRLALGAAFHFAFQRYARDVTVARAPGAGGAPIQDLRTLTYYDLSVQQTASLALGRVHPFAALGAGLTMGHFSTLEPALGEERMVRALFRVAAGLDVTVADPELRVGIEIDYAHVLGTPQLRTTTGERDVFGSRAGISLWGRHAF